MWWPENVFLYNFCRSSLAYAVNENTPDLFNCLSGTLEGIDIPCKRYVILGRSWSVESVMQAFKLKKKKQQKKDPLRFPQMLGNQGTEQCWNHCCRDD